MPLIRYRTHDFSRLVLEPCSCGASSLLKFDKVKKRLETIAIIGDGDEMYPALFDDVLFEIPDLVDYQVIVTGADGRDRLDFRIELISDRNPIPEISAETIVSADNREEHRRRKNASSQDRAGGAGIAAVDRPGKEDDPRPPINPGRPTRSPIFSRACCARR